MLEITQKLADKINNLINNAGDKACIGVMSGTNAVIVNGKSYAVENVADIVLHDKAVVYCIPINTSNKAVVIGN